MCERRWSLQLKRPWLILSADGCLRQESKLSLAPTIGAPTDCINTKFLQMMLSGTTPPCGRPEHQKPELSWQQSYIHSYHSANKTQLHSTKP